MAACHENSAWLTNVCAFGRRPKSFHSLSTSHLERFSVWWVSASWQPDLVTCPPLLAAPGWVSRTVDLLGHCLRLQPAPCPLCHGLLPGTAHPPFPWSNGVDLNCHHCQRPVMLWLCCPWQGRFDLWGIYRLLRCIIDFIIICLHIATLLCSQTTAPKVEWRQSSLSVAPTMLFFFFFFAFSQTTRHRSFEACFVDFDQNIDYFKTYSQSELLFLIKGHACKDNWFTGSFFLCRQQHQCCPLGCWLPVRWLLSSCKNEDEGARGFSLGPVNNTCTFIGGFCHVCLMTWWCREN